MRYHICVDDIKIASFTNEHDRDACMDALEKEFPDALLRSVDD